GGDAAVQLLQSGAVDYVNKNDLKRLVPAVKRALSDADARRAREAAERALQESEQQLRELNETLEQRVQGRTSEVMAQTRLLQTAINTLRDAFYLLDENGKLVRWNNTLRQSSGLSEERLAGMPLSQLVVESDREKLNAWLEELRQQNSATCELHFRSAKETPFEFSGALLQDENGNVEGICGIAHNVAARRQTEAQLKEAIRTV